MANYFYIRSDQQEIIDVLRTFRKPAHRDGWSIDMIRNSPFPEERRAVVTALRSGLLRINPDTRMLHLTAAGNKVLGLRRKKARRHKKAGR